MRKLLQKEISYCNNYLMALDNQKLLTELSLTFPNGIPADLGRRLSHCYEASWLKVLQDKDIGNEDRIQTAGHIRRAYVNSMLHQLAKDCGWHSNNVSMGRGIDNHVELVAGRLVITCHHLTNGRKLPSQAKYLEQNWELNSSLSQGELFDRNNFSLQKTSPKIFNLLITHTTNEENIGQVGMIDFVFASGKEILAKFDITDVIKYQSDLNDMPEESLDDLRSRYEIFRADKSA